MNALVTVMAGIGGSLTYLGIVGWIQYAKWNRQVRMSQDSNRPAIHFYISNELKDQVKAEAKRIGGNMGDVIIIALREYLAKRAEVNGGGDAT